MPVRTTIVPASNCRLRLDGYTDGSMLIHNITGTSNISLHLGHIRSLVAALQEYIQAYEESLPPQPATRRLELQISNPGDGDEPDI